MKTAIVTYLSILHCALAIRASEFHVAVSGSDTNAGNKNSPFRTIQHAAELAQPGDVITVHQGVYRERINPPRGGTSDAKRIVYQAAPGETVVIKGSEVVKNWVKVQANVWKVTLPNTFFGGFNPYHELIQGDWFNPKGRQHHAGAVYLNGDWLIEAASLDSILKTADVAPTVTGDYLLNVAWIRPANSLQRIAADGFAAQNGFHEGPTAPCSEGGQCIGWIQDGAWVRYERVDFGERSERVEIRASSITGAGKIELRQDSPAGELLGVCRVTATGDWQKWDSFNAPIKPTSGVKNLCLVFKSAKQSESAFWFGQVDQENTTLWAQFGDANPNTQEVEINVRNTVFYPDQPGRDYITVRGFTLRQAATSWAPPTAEQRGLIGTHWSKGWIIESNVISHSKCSGISLGKYGDEWDNRAESAEGYVGTINRALTNGWNQATVGSHLVRNNEISHCEQTGIVGSLGCSFSTVTGNTIHDIHVHGLFGGAEMAGIKFHGAIDVVISHNHIYRTCLGLWLDWMAQGARVTGNLLQENTTDLFLEMQHGPTVVDNNLFLSKRLALNLNSQGIAFVHNLIAGPTHNHRNDRRSTPYHPAHTTAVAGLYDAAQGDSGDYRFYNNLFVAPSSLQTVDNSLLPCFGAGNVFTKGTQPSKFDTEALVLPGFDAGLKLERKSDGWYLTLAEDRSWCDSVKRQTVTSERLGKAKVSACAYENADGSPLRINTDYFGKPRNESNPTPGPFANPGTGRRTIKVW